MLAKAAEWGGAFEGMPKPGAYGQCRQQHVRRPTALGLVVMVILIMDLVPPNPHSRLLQIAALDRIGRLLSGWNYLSVTIARIELRSIQWDHATCRIAEKNPRPLTRW